MLHRVKLHIARLSRQERWALAGLIALVIGGPIAPPLAVLFLLVLLIWKIPAYLTQIGKTARKAVFAKRFPDALIVAGALVLVVGLMSFQPVRSTRSGEDLLPSLPELPSLPMLPGRGFSSRGMAYSLESKIIAALGVAGLVVGILMRKRIR